MTLHQSEVEDSASPSNLTKKTARSKRSGCLIPLSIVAAILFVAVLKMGINTLPGMLAALSEIQCEMDSSCRAREDARRRQEAQARVDEFMKSLDKKALAPSLAPPETTTQGAPVEDRPAESSQEETGDEKRLRHLEMLALEELGNCLVKYDKFNDDKEAQDKCRQIAVQRAQNRYISGD